MTKNTFKAITGVLVVAAAISLGWQQPGKPAAFTLNGLVSDFKDSVVFLTYGTFDNTKIDSAKVTDGKFTFKGKVGEPLQAMLFSRNYRLRFDLYVDGGNIALTGSMNELTVTGSPAVNEYEVFNKQIMGNRKRVQDLFNEGYQERQKGDTLRAKELEKEGQRLYDYENVMRMNYVKEHPASPIAVRELQMLVNNKNLAECTQMYAALDPKVKASEQGIELGKRFDILNSITTGKEALPFSQNDVNGKPVTLASYKGKYVLLEFWASWCGPCRAENPNLLKQKEQYGDKFSVLGVSLDKAKQPWVDAIAKDGLTWTQVSDLKGWNNEIAVKYGIKAVPANFLIDPNGKIIAQDLRGEALNKKLKELFQ